MFTRIEKQFGRPDAAFGVRDGIPEDVEKVDLAFGLDWKTLPFKDNQFAFGYWDPPYPPAVKGLMKPEALEIWRTCRRLAILHTHVYPISWFPGAVREAMVAVTMGPLKVIRVLQVYRKTPRQEALEGGAGP